MAAFDTWAKGRAAIGWRLGRVLPHGDSSFSNQDGQMILRMAGQEDLENDEAPEGPAIGKRPKLRLVHVQGF